MSITNNRVIWTEGMFLKPHHFQQQERYFDYQQASRFSAISPYHWGILHYELDQQLIKQGKLAISSCEVIFPDYTYCSIPHDTATPAPIDIPKNTANTTAYLAVPLHQQGVPDTKLSGNTDATTAFRYQSQLIDINDFNTNFNDSTQIEVGKLQPRLLLTNTQNPAYSNVAIAHIKEVSPNGSVILDKQYIPNCFNLFASDVLKSMCREVSVLLQNRAEAIATSMLHEQGRIDTSDLMGALVLQIIHRYVPVLDHMQNRRHAHPEDFYVLLSQLLAELATFTEQNHRPPVIAPYQHDNPTPIFIDIMNALRSSLSTVFQQKAIALKLTKNEQGLWVHELENKDLLKQAEFIFAVNAEGSAKELRERFPKQIKIGPIESINQMINHAIPGIPIESLPVAPRQLPYIAGACYFQLDKNTDYWQKLTSSAALALQISHQPSNFSIELWAINNS